MKPARAITRRAALCGLGAAVLSLGTGCDDGVRVKPEHDPLAGLKSDGVRPEVLRYGITPSAGADTIKQLAPLIRYLERVLGVGVVGTTAADYGQLADLLKSGEVHVGQFTPAAFVASRKGLPGVALATATNGGSPTYLSYLITRGEPPAPRLEALRGKRIAWVHRTSTSGYIYPRWLLCRRGFDPDTFFARPPLFAGDHAAAMQALRDGVVDVAAIASNFIDLASPSGPIGSVQDVVVVAKSARIPLDCIVAHASLQDTFAKQLRDALLNVAVDAELRQALTRTWGINGFVAAREEHYAEVAEVMANELSQCKVQ